MLILNQNNISISCYQLEVLSSIYEYHREKPSIMEPSENEMDQLLLADHSILFKYLPFIENMRLKAEGAELQVKWQQMYNAIVEPKKMYDFYSRKMGRIMQ